MILHFWARDFGWAGVQWDLARVRVTVSKADVEFAKQQLEAEDSEYYR